jgi:hypothetical protein
MAGRSDVLGSAAYAALSDGGRRVFQVIEEQAGRGAVAISLGRFMQHGMCRSTAIRGIRQCEVLGFVSVAVGHRSVGVFRLADGWRGLDMDEAARRVRLARLPMPPRQRVPPGPVLGAVRPAGGVADVRAGQALAGL